MKHPLLRSCFAWFVFAVVSSPLCAAAAPASESAAAPRVRESFDFGWRFQRGDVPEAAQPGFDDNGWRTLELPHDWSIEGPYDREAPTGGPGGYLPAGVGWYRKTFELPESARGRVVTIQFDGVYMNSTVWINGHELGTWPSGYTSFVYDLTPHLRFGGERNVVAVRVDNSRQPNSRWYSGSGIYRHVWLTTTDPLHVPAWGVTVTTPEISDERALVRVRTEVRNDGRRAEPVRIACAVLDAAGRIVAETPPQSAGEIEAGAQAGFAGELNVPRPQRWSPVSPNLYRVRTTVFAGERFADVVETTFGVRSIAFEVDRGFVLNGEKVILRGMCLHHDGGAVGAAVPEAVLRRRLELLQEMGCNAVRTSHNPMAPEFYELCDELGLLVMDEPFDEWTVRKPQIRFGYSDYFAEWFERDLVAFIRRDRNHPSVVLWSAGNEIGEQGVPHGADVLRPLVEIFHREDPTRPVTAALDNAFTDKGHIAKAFTDLLDVVGYNYVDRWGSRRETHYADDRVLFPERKFIGTENASVRGVRGDYRFGPLLMSNQADPRTRRRARSGPEGALYAGDSLRAASLWRFVATRDYVAGDFAWTGFDYLGEARWPAKAATSGALDTCGFKKDAFYFYQSLWTDQPMVHLLPHWNWPDRLGRVVPVIAYTNCPVVELFLNGRSLGAKAKEFPRQGAAGGWNSYAQPIVDATTSDLHLLWDVPYEPGELKAVGYDRTGAVVVETIMRTAGEPAALRLTVDRAAIAADRRDVAHITVEAVDAAGAVVPDATNLVTFELSGPGRLIAVDNGDPASHASYQGNTRALHAGMALALVQSTAEPGTLRLVARAEGLQEAAVEIATQRLR